MAVLRTSVVPSCIKVELLGNKLARALKCDYDTVLEISMLSCDYNMYGCHLTITVNIDNAIVTDIDNVILRL